MSGGYVKRVILLSGPRGAGKSVFARNVAERHSQVMVVSRDDILRRLFGLASFSSEQYNIGFLAVMREVKGCLEEGQGDNTIILDCWNATSCDRKAIIRELRTFGADKVFCWQFFITPDLNVRWFMQKQDAKLSEYAIRFDHERYYQLAKGIHDDGFDAVFPIYSNQLTFDGWPFL